MPDPASVTGMRRSYARGRLEEADLAADWVTQFPRWFGEAVESAQSVPRRQALASAAQAAPPPQSGPELPLKYQGLVAPWPAGS